LREGAPARLPRGPPGLGPARPGAAVSLTAAEREAAWPALPLEAWSDTLATLHLWTQVVGKARLERGPWLTHSWNDPLFVTPRGLDPAPLPHGLRTFEIQLDFIEHRLRIDASDG